MNELEQFRQDTIRGYTMYTGYLIDKNVMPYIPEDKARELASDFADWLLSQVPQEKISEYLMKSSINLKNKN